ncbi:MAG: chemotaxis protein CheC [Anaerofustis sp.]
MTIENLEQLNDIHLDVLREVGNIGAGNAATSLSAMLDRMVDMSTPSVKIVDINKATESLGGPENVVVGILGKLKGDIDGLIVFMIEQNFALAAINFLLQNRTENCTELTDIEFSVLAEIGNIMISSYISAISALSGLEILTSVPAVNVDMVGSLLSVPAIVMEDYSDKIIYIENDFMNIDERITANMLLMPSIDSLNKIMVGLGIA